MTTEEDFHCKVTEKCIFVFGGTNDSWPKADIYCLINTELKPEIFHGMRSACQMYGVRTISFDNIDKNVVILQSRGCKI